MLGKDYHYKLLYKNNECVKIFLKQIGSRIQNRDNPEESCQNSGSKIDSNKYCISTACDVLLDSQFLPTFFPLQDFPYRTFSNGTAHLSHLKFCVYETT